MIFKELVMILDLIIVGSAFLAITSFALWALQGVGGPVEARIRALGLGHSAGDVPDEELPLQARVIAPLVESIGRRAAAILPAAFLRRVEKKLVLAGEPMRPAAFYALMLGVGGLVGGTYIALIVAGSDGVPSFLALAPALLLVVIGIYLVNFWLSGQARSRKKAMTRGLPDTMDLLTICVEAGLGLDAAFHRIVEKQSGPLVDEIRQMLREIGLGKSRSVALIDLSDRTDLDEVRTFANAVNQAEQLGSSIARVLKAQSDRLRVRRRQQAEQEARKAPVKMVFPLVFCLMPSLFIFILGPIIINLMSFLNGQ